MEHILYHEMPQLRQVILAFGLLVKVAHPWGQADSKLLTVDEGLVNDQHVQSLFIDGISDVIVAESTRILSSFCNGFNFR